MDDSSKDTKIAMLPSLNGNRGDKEMKAIRLLVLIVFFQITSHAQTANDNAGVPTGRPSFSCDLVNMVCVCEGAKSGADCQAMKINCDGPINKDTDHFYCILRKTANAISKTTESPDSERETVLKGSKRSPNQSLSSRESSVPMPKDAHDRYANLDVIDHRPIEPAAVAADNRNTVLSEARLDRIRQDLRAATRKIQDRQLRSEIYKLAQVQPDESVDEAITRIHRGVIRLQSNHRTYGDRALGKRYGKSCEEKCDEARENCIDSSDILSCDVKRSICSLAC